MVFKSSALYLSYTYEEINKKESDKNSTSIYAIDQ